MLEARLLLLRWRSRRAGATRRFYSHHADEFLVGDFIIMGELASDFFRAATARRAFRAAASHDVFLSAICQDMSTGGQKCHRSAQGAARASLDFRAHASFL